MIRSRHLLGAALLALLPLACAPNQEPGKRTLSLWGLAPDDKGLEAVVAKFEAIHPDVHVKVLNLGAGGMNPQKLMTSIVGRVPPDLIYQDRFTVADWASRGAFMPLDELIEKDKARDPLCPTKAEYYPAAWQEASYGGKTFGIPTGIDDRALYYNKRLFRDRAADLRAKGLNPTRPPRTWSELLAYAKALTTDKTLGFVPNYGNSWLYLYAFQNNAHLLSSDGRTCALGSPEVQEALEFMKQGYAAAGGYERAAVLQTAGLDKGNDPFMRGQVAMKIDGDWILGDIARYAPDLDFGVAPAPVPDDRLARRGRFKGEAQPFVTWSGGQCYSIPVGAGNVEDAWNFIKWACSKDAALVAARAEADSARQAGRAFIPRQSANIAANGALFSEFKPADAKFAEALTAHMDLMASSRVRPPTFAGQLLWDEQVRAVDNACSGRTSVKDALVAGQAKVQRELDDVYGQSRFPVVDLHWIFSLGLAAMGLVGAGWILWIRRKRPSRLARQETGWAYAFVSPWLFGFVVLTLGPMLASLFFSFTQFNVLGPARWVGGKNYADLLTVDNALAGKALFNACYLAGVGVPLGIVTGLAVALLLNASVRGMAVYRTFFFMPAVVPSVASAVLWWWLLAPDPHFGLVNAAWAATLGSWFHLDPPGWIMAEAWAKPSLILMGLWGAGTGMLLWLSGLKGIPANLYEAASIDGASSRRQFWSVTLPHLTPLVFFSMVMGLIGSLQEFDRVYTLTAGSNFGPGDSMLTPAYLLFSNGFSYFRMGYASAIAWAIFLVILVLTLIQFRFAPRWVHYEGEQ